MRFLALSFLFSTALLGQQEESTTPIPALPIVEDISDPQPTPPDEPAESTPTSTTEGPTETASTLTPSGRIYIPSDPNPNREPAFDEIVPSQESQKDENTPQDTPESLKTPPKDDGIRVSVLGYHEFAESLPNTAMRIQSTKFRKQMEALRDLGKPIITMEEFMKWKKGEGTLPPQSFLITIDDGWKSVYTEAYPVLKELKIPFTLFLYKKYVVPGGGRSLTVPMIQEMLDSGLCTIGGHSYNHPFPSEFRKAQKKGEEFYHQFLTKELIDSKVFLEKHFSISIPTYAYPGGYITEDMRPYTEEAGYEFLFSVNPGMTRLSADNNSLPRYIILGNHDGIFQLATTFRETATNAGNDGIIIQNTKHPVAPTPGAIITSRLPLIAADLSQESEVDPDSIVMRIGGFGKVPAVWDDANKTFSWQINRPLRIPSCQVSVQWRLKDHREYEIPMRWSFRVDLEASYQPR